MTSGVMFAGTSKEAFIAFKVSTEVLGEDAKVLKLLVAFKICVAVGGVVVFSNIAISLLANFVYMAASTVFSVRSHKIPIKPVSHPVHFLVAVSHVPLF